MKKTIAVLVALVVSHAFVSSAEAARVKNGGFEKGSLAGWQKSEKPSPFCGRWQVYTDMFRGVGVPLPPQGHWAALAYQDECPSSQILSQVVKLKKGQKHRLRFRLAYFSEEPHFFTPPRLTHFGGPNQQIRVDVVKPNAPIRSVKPKHVLKRVFRTEEGDPQGLPYTRFKANLTKFAGKKVRLRFAVVVNQWVVGLGLDDVKVVSQDK